MLKSFTQITFQARLPIVFSKEDNWYISHCPVVDVCSQGYTKKEAEKNLKEELYLFFISCYERGTLDEVLKECGFIPGEAIESNKHSFDKSINVNIPFAYKKANKPFPCPA